MVVPEGGTGNHEEAGNEAAAPVTVCKSQEVGAFSGYRKFIKSVAVVEKDYHYAAYRTYQV